MTQQEIIETLKNEVTKSKAAEAIATSWAARDRARYQVTLEALGQRMKKEGFDFDQTEYANWLKLLARLGFGKLETDSRGRVIALRSTAVRLQSIGAVALGQSKELVKFRQRHKFTDIRLNPTLQKPLSPPPTPKVEIKAPMDIKLAKVTVEVNGKEVVLQLPKNVTADEINLILSKF